ncbi:MAG: hypothetical protein QM764_02825 [Chitinophagaceae bacterium]
MKKRYIILSVLLTITTFCFSQDATKTINEIDDQLTKGKKTISAVLSDPQYVYLHSQTPFRLIVRKHAKAEKLKIVTANEPGRRITVKVKIEITEGKPLADALVYFYHTSDKGWYSDTAAHILIREGDMGHARLFGYAKTDAKGRIEFETIQPKGYPKSDFPGHIHVMVWKDDQVVAGIPNELQFDDDIRMTPERRARSLREGNLIEKNSGTQAAPVYSYSIRVKN